MLISAAMTFVQNYIAQLRLRREQFLPLNASIWHDTICAFEDIEQRRLVV
jgi:hypothetical protein